MAERDDVRRLLTESAARREARINRSVDLPRAERADSQGEFRVEDRVDQLAQSGSVLFRVDSLVGPFGVPTVRRVRRVVPGCQPGYASVTTPRTGRAWHT